MWVISKVVSVLAIIFSAVISLVFSTSAVPVYLLSPRLGTKIHQLWGWLVCGSFGIRVEIRGLENLPDRGVMAPNHESLFDILVLACLPVHFRWIAKEQVKRIPGIGWVMWAMGCFFLKRDRSGHDLKVMKGVETALSQGALVAIFPEGTRTRTGQLLPFKKGAFKTAVNAGVPVIPVAISGTFHIAPPGRLPDRWGHRVVVAIGKPVPTVPSRPLEVVMTEYRATLEQLLAQSRAGGNALSSGESDLAPT